MPIPKNYTSSIRLTAKEKAFRQLQSWIIDGTLEPGEKLYDAEIAEAIGVSRTPVREAFQLLEVQGFIETYRGRDTRVTTVSKEDVQTMYVPLASLQALAAQLAATAITEEQIATLNEINASYKQAIYDKDVPKIVEMDSQFHTFILEIVDNPYIINFTSVLQLHIQRLEYIFFKQQHIPKEESIDEHERIVQAFVQKNGKLAAEIMEQNWLRPMKEVYQLM
ncbi:MULTISPECIES: GntR family transcriptional regulator [Brevibacillus]|uniref:GntR family transcriptional regulator n=1 Tax=Brevibacillus TaxID=55080 RepID=UPI0002403B57|nr:MULTISPECIES: GntR family transcriptional regulator [Brevibacillus]AUM65050.1 GntR family transcriptional regulator [Brevibacillus laterosporus]AYK08053.1 GntR family transcriptional regulator [Brevibacillus laterosporus]MBA4532890.1 GntR family transcriptional regulator [Brevibacillus halotolerans]MCR8963596.1 GntR family transcriptional regulator [Brevibacillus laterosporus]MCR8993936.1 GntR family transcriptional regulator [Brevibacillus laterosporus]